MDFDEEASRLEGVTPLGRIGGRGGGGGCVSTGEGMVDGGGGEDGGTNGLEVGKVISSSSGDTHKWLSRGKSDANTYYRTKCSGRSDWKGQSTRETIRGVHMLLIQYRVH